MKYLEDIGSYFLMLRRTFSGFTKGDVLRDLKWQPRENIEDWIKYVKSKRS